MKPQKLEKIEQYKSAPPPKGDYSHKLTYSDYEWVVSLINVTRVALNKTIDHISSLEERIKTLEDNKGGHR